MTKKAIVLVNLGTPETATPRAVSGFLKQFLSDPRVVEAPKWLWWFLLRLVIIPLRAKKVAHSYSEIWWEEGSPLRVITRRQVSALQQLLNDEMDGRAPLVTEAMTYGEPSLANTIHQLQGQGVEQFFLIPMYPQYSGSTTGAIYDQVADIIKCSRDVPDVRVVKSFHDHPGYINSLVKSVQASWAKHGRHEKLLMSFHGIPQEYVDKGDPYYRHCRETAEAVAAALALSDSDWKMTFQSRFGPKKWLQPYTDEQLKKWVEEGVKSIDVVSPAFTADCLETLEELNISYRELFVAGSDRQYQYIPCVNDDAAFIKFLPNLLKGQLFD
ncbi:MAG: ferrochelatase [Gammaproteobacteria bacterium]|nr:MAG: ferrochelatase [Gammaproteobacteria bacterium]